jgi:hypothetical protein
VVLPSEQHRRLYQVLHATARPGAGGYPVSSWWQRDLAKRLQVSERTLKRLLADLREPGPPDDRHPRATKAAGRRLGLLKVERTKYRDKATGQHRRGHNLYVLLVPAEVIAGLPVSGQRATWPFDLTSGNGEHVALGKPEITPSLEEVGGYLSVPTDALPSPGTAQENSDIRSTIGGAARSTDSDLSEGLRRFLELGRAEGWVPPRRQQA